MKKRIVSLVSVMALSGLAYAGGDVAPIEEPVIIPVVDNSGFYIGGAYSFMSYNETYNDGVTADVDTSGLTFIAGYQFNSYISLEGRYTTDVGGFDEDWSDGRTRNDTENEMSNVALYLKPSYEIDNFKIYGLLGYGQMSYQYENTIEQKGSGFQWGLGAGYTFYDNVSVFVDYTKLYDDTGFDDYISNVDYDADAWTVGITYLF